MKNLKDKLSTVCGIIVVMAGVVLSLPTQGVVIPPVLNTIAIVAGAVAGAIIGILTGKTSDGTTKKLD